MIIPPACASSLREGVDEAIAVEYAPSKIMIIFSAAAVYLAELTVRLEVVLGEAGTIHPRRSIGNHRRTPTAVTMSEHIVKCDARLILYAPGCTSFCVE